MRFADLHLHTHHSDGTRSPAEIIDLAVEHQLAIVSISDHDHLAAFDEITSYAADQNVLLVPGIEFSCEYRGVDVHVLAYAFRPEDSRIRENLERFRATRRDRGRRMVEKLVDLGYPITLERVQELSGGGSLGRPHVARALVEAGSVASIDEAFDRLLSPGCPGFVGKERFRVPEAVEMVHAAGGVLSIAHPTLYPEGRLITVEVLDQGVDGIEVFHPQVDLESREFYRALARDRGTMITGGSDDHGFEGRRDIGTVRVPEELLGPILERVEIRA
ncbi:MAG TPA: PHP domain-containing protein [Thermoanaerobaculia bacterium]|nr:PHP domain-containing protein [Thermoanaerobaculia bacterium]